MIRLEFRRVVRFALLSSVAAFGLLQLAPSAGNSSQASPACPGSGKCTKCQCDSFSGSGEYCLRTSCKHSYGNHKS